MIQGQLQGVGAGDEVPFPTCMWKTRQRKVILCIMGRTRGGGGMISFQRRPE